MSWRDYLQTEERVTLPWIGGNTLQTLQGRKWKLGSTPSLHGWYTFKVEGRKVVSFEESAPNLSALGYPKTGYMVGNSLVVPDKRGFRLQPVHLVERGLDRFSRVLVGSLSDGGPLVYQGQEMPLGPEDAVLETYLNRTPVDNIPGATPELLATYRYEVQYRERNEKRQAELEAKRQYESRIGTGEGRRILARTDFEAAARSALSLGGATLLDVRDGVSNQKIVRFQLGAQRFECVCDTNLQIIDAGICLTAEYDDGTFDRGVRGDTWFTLESLPSVIMDAINQNHLVIFRRA